MQIPAKTGIFFFLRISYNIIPNWNKVLEIFWSGVSFWEYIIPMIYPGLQIIVYKTEGYAYPVWHDVCWGGDCTLVQYCKFFRQGFLSK